MIGASRGVKPLMRRRVLLVGTRTGLRERVRARFSNEESEEPASSSAAFSGIGCGVLTRCLRVVERVTGAKYESLFPGCDVESDNSEGVGEGDMTRGVEGTWYCCDMMADGGRSGMSGEQWKAISPTGRRRKRASL